MKTRNYRLAATLLSLATLFAGCGKETTSPAPATAHSPDEHGHDDSHSETGPHQGHLIELGKGEYHAELAHDDASQTVTVYLLATDAKSAVTVGDAELTLNLVVDGKPQQITLAAAPLAGEAAGQTSRFTLVDAAAIKALDSPKTTGRLNVSIGGKDFIGTFSAHDHAHEH